MAVCRSWEAPVLSPGGGTSLAGQCCNVTVVLDYLNYMNRVLSVDAEARSGRVEPGWAMRRIEGVPTRFAGMSTWKDRKGRTALLSFTTRDDIAG
jgi:hypothetical protein